LYVGATSSDKILPGAVPAPILSLKVQGTSYPMVQTAAGRYSATLTGLLAPPPRVTVTSSEGGRDTHHIAD
jgi:hypothetical protein